MPLPNAEPIGLPAPDWLLQFLLVLTFSLHIIPMGLTLGGALVALWAEMTGRAADRSGHRLLAERLWRLLPSITAFTITLGVAPLLFVQLIYGKFFYPASILTGWSWIAVVPLLILGYGGLYIQAMTPSGRPWRPWAGLLSILSFLSVAAIYVSTMSLTTRPDLWMGMYEATQAGTHWFLNLPRYLHVLLGAITLTGGLTGLIGHLAKEPEISLAGRRTGFWLISVSVVLQAPVSFWYYTTFTETARAATQPLIMGAAMVFGAATLLLLLRREPSPLVGWLTIGAIAGSGILLAIQRHLVRQALLQPHLTPADWQVSPQWDVFAIFALLLVGALGLVGFLLWRFLREPAEAEGLTPRAKAQ